MGIYKKTVYNGFCEKVKWIVGWDYSLVTNLENQGYAIMCNSNISQKYLDDLRLKLQSDKNSILNEAFISTLKVNNGVCNTEFSKCSLCMQFRLYVHKSEMNNNLLKYKHNVILTPPENFKLSTWQPNS